MITKCFKKHTNFRWNIRLILFYLGEKSKEEVEEIINNMFFSTKEKELILTPTEHK